MSNAQILTKKVGEAPGIIFVVATPIGNLEDMSARAVETLKAVQLIVAEDTRHSAPLLNHFGIATTLTALHDHNERDKTDSLIAKVQRGASIAMISDAGTPLISDPGFHLIATAVTQGIRVVPIPGACAAIAALSVAGLPSDRFAFEGFLSAKDGARTKRLQQLVNEERTLIFYESPHRLLATLNNMLEVFGVEREIVLAKELTKLFETVYKSTIPELMQWLDDKPERQKGEFVLLLQGKPKEATEDDALTIDATLKVLLNELSLKQAVDIAVKLTGQSKNQVYQRALSISKK